MLAEGRRREDQLKAFDLDHGWGFVWDNAAKFRVQWEKMRDERPRGGARFIRFIDNHDIARIVQRRSASRFPNQLQGPTKR